MQGEKTYWATRPAEDVKKFINTRLEEQRTFTLTYGRASLWQRSHNEYYRAVNHKGRMFRTGPQNEYLNTYVNHFRNILQHLLVSTTGERPNLRPIALNTDHKSAAQTIVANGVLDYFDRTKGIGEAIVNAMENLLIYGEGAIGVYWDAQMGKPYTADKTGRMVYEGDLDLKVYTPMQILYDMTQTDQDAREWVIATDYVSKWNLAAKYPQFADDIIDAAIGPEEHRYVTFQNHQLEGGDIVPLRRFFHRKSPALPQGRYIEIAGDNTVLMDNPLPYKEIPVYIRAASYVKGTTMPHTVAFDMLPIQEWVNKLYSVILTNQSTFGVQNILNRRGSGVTVSQLSGGLNLINYDGDQPPTALNLLQTNPEIFTTINMLVKDMETISGVNSVVRGNPESSLKSGTALALVASQAVHFNSGFQKAYATLFEDVSTAVLNLLKTFATTNRIALISGKSNRNYLKEFNADDLDTIDRVVVELGNPMMRTAAGRMQFADAIMAKGMIKVPEEYFNLIATGRYEPMLEGEQAEVLLIRRENEDLMDGMMVNAIKTDPHALHIKEHMAVLASPEARMVPQLVMKVLAHIDQHLALLRLVDPGLNMINGQPMLPPPLPMPPIPGMNGPVNAPPPNVSMISGARKPETPSPANNPVTGKPAEAGPR